MMRRPYRVAERCSRLSSGTSAVSGLVDRESRRSCGAEAPECEFVLAGDVAGVGGGEGGMRGELKPVAFAPTVKAWDTGSVDSQI